MSLIQSSANKLQGMFRKQAQSSADDAAKLAKGAADDVAKALKGQADNLGKEAAERTAKKASVLGKDALMINGKVRNDLQVVKLRQGVLDEAKKLAELAEQGADDVFFKAGQDTYVASGAGVLKQKKLWNILDVDPNSVKVELDGKAAEILHLDNQANDAKEAMQWAVQYAGMQTVLAPTGMATYVAASAIADPKVQWAVIGGTAAASSTALLSGAAWLGPRRQMDLTSLAKLGEVVQEATVKKGVLSGDAINRILGKF